MAVKSRDASALAEEHYAPVSALLEFAAGERSRHLSVGIIDTPNWNASLEFALELSDVVGAQLSDTLSTCHVWILDLDTFPSSEVEAGKTSRLRLMREFYSYCLRIPRVRRGAVKILLIDLCENLFSMWQLIIQVCTDV